MAESTEENIRRIVKLLHKTATLGDGRFDHGALYDACKLVGVSPGHYGVYEQHLVNDGWAQQHTVSKFVLTERAVRFAEGSEDD